MFQILTQSKARQQLKVEKKTELREEQDGRIKLGLSLTFVGFIAGFVISDNVWSDERYRKRGRETILLELE